MGVRPREAVVFRGSRQEMLSIGTAQHNRDLRDMVNLLHVSAGDTRLKRWVPYNAAKARVIQPGHSKIWIMSGSARMSLRAVSGFGGPN